MHRAQDQVRDFHRACGLRAPEQCEPGGLKDLTLRRDLIEEEAEEFRRAVADADLVEMVDALCDLLYVTYGAAVAMGIDLEKYFEEVHMTNMKKCTGPKREDGKQLKPEGWEPPRIKEMLMTLEGWIPRGASRTI